MQNSKSSKVQPRSRIEEQISNPGQDYSDAPGVNDGQSVEDGVMITSHDKKSIKASNALNTVGTHGQLSTSENIRRQIGAKSSGLSQGSNNGSQANMKRDTAGNQRGIVNIGADSIMAQGHAWTNQTQGRVTSIGSNQGSVPRSKNGTNTDNIYSNHTSPPQYQGMKGSKNSNQKHFKKMQNNNQFNMYQPSNVPMTS